MATDENWTENFLFVNCHVAFYIVNYSGTDKIAYFVQRVLIFTAIENNFSTLFLGSFNQFNDSLLQLWITHRTEICIFLVSWTNFQLLCLSSNLLNQLWWISHKYSYWYCHTSLTCCTESRIDNGVYSIHFICIGHNYSVIFGSHITLSSFACFSANFVYILTSLVTAHEWNSSNVFMMNDMLRSLKSSLNHIYYSRR